MREKGWFCVFLGFDPLPLLFALNVVGLGGSGANSGEAFLRVAELSDAAPFAASLSVLMFGFFFSDSDSDSLEESESESGSGTLAAVSISSSDSDSDSELDELSEPDSEELPLSDSAFIAFFGLASSSPERRRMKNRIPMKSFRLSYPAS